MSKHHTKMTLNSWIMIFAIGVLVFLMNIDYTAVNLALVPIAEETNGDLNMLQWLLSGYILIWAALVVPAGRFADIYGKTFSINLGVVIFMIGSLLTAMGHEVWLLIVGRLVQGLGAAIFAAPAYSMIFASVPTSKQGMAMGFMGGSAGLGLATGPTISGWIINEIGWRWLFYVNIPIGILVIAILLIFAKKEEKQTNPPTIDWVNVIALTCGLGAVVFAINQIEVWGILDLKLWFIGLSGFACLVFFRRRDKKQKFQILPSTLLSNKPFLSAVATCFIVAYGFSLVFVMMSLYMQNTLKLSSEMTGYYFLAMTIPLGILSPIGGKLADKINTKIPILTGLCLTIVSYSIFSLLTAQSTNYIVWLGLLFAGLGLGIGFPAMNTAMFRSLEPSEINTGSAIFTMGMTLGNAVSVVVSTSLLVLFGRLRLVDLISEAGTSITPQGQQTLIDVISKVEHTAAQLKDFPSQQVPELLNLIDLAFLRGFAVTWWVGIVLCVIAGVQFLKYYKEKNTQPHTAAPVII